MLYIGILLVFVLGVIILGGDNKAKLLDEYCKVECKKDILKAHKFCC